MNVKKKLSLLLALAMVFSLVACGDGNDASNNDETKTSEFDENGVYQGKGNGYGGELNVDVTFEDGKIKDISLGDNHESSPVITRAFPVIKERIIEAQSPVVDSVSSATYSSFAVKTAVAEAAKTYGLDFGSIAMDTAAPPQEVAEAPAVETDLVIVGGGPAGLSAAITAKENGVKNVTVVEKLDILSGNGKFDMNFFDIVGTEAQKANGIEDSADKFFADKQGNVNDSDERLHVWADGAASVDKWLRGMGVELNYNYGERNHMAEADQYAGEVVQGGLEAKVEELGVDVRTGTKGVDLITAEDGTVKGVKVESKNEKYDIMADAVIMATGGFCFNKDLIAQYVPGAEIINTSNSMGATGDFIPVFIGNNYKMADMDTLSIFKMINVPNRELTGGGDGFILVNNEGKRFVDESSSGLDYAYKLLDQPDSEVYYIYDQRLYDETYRLQKHNKLGYHKKADTLEDLAEQLGIPADNLIAEVEAYNAAVKGEGEDKFRAEPFTEPIDMDGPFYGAQVEPAIHMTKGGVVANENAQILTESGEVVPNLYAAGEVTATSAAFSGSVIWGRVAGEQAAKLIADGGADASETTESGENVSE